MNKTAAVTDDQVHILGLDPTGLGGAALGALRGKSTNRVGQGALRGAMGTWAGGSLGAAALSLPGAIVASHGGASALVPGQVLKRVGGWVGALGGGAMGAHLATRGMLEKTSMFGEAAVMPLQQALMKRVGSEVEQGLVNKLMVQAGKALPHVRINMNGAPGNGFYSLAEQSATAARGNAHILAHELGHAHIDNHRLGKLLQNAGTEGVGTSVPVVGFAGGLASGYSDESSGKNHVGRDALIGGALSAPQLAYEFGASAKGHQLLKEVGANAKSLGQYRARTGAALGTYALQPVAGAINYGIGRGVGQWAARSDAKAKAARAAKGATMKTSSLECLAYAAMRDELASTKVAINLAPLAAMGGKALGAIESVGARALGAATNLAGRSGGAVGQQVAGGLLNAGQRLGTQNMSRLAGGALVGAGALGAAGAARTALAGPGTVR